MLALYKEWSLVCEALKSGEQTVLLRRGGIAEEAGGFSFKHKKFLLLPTFFHQQAEKVYGMGTFPPPAGQQGFGAVTLQAEVVAVVLLTDWNRVQALQPFHIWREKTIRERFEAKGQNLIHAALVRISKIAEVVHITESAETAGCRSWIELPDGAGFTPLVAEAVLGDDIFANIEQRFREITGAGNAG